MRACSGRGAHRGFMQGTGVIPGLLEVTCSDSISSRRHPPSTPPPTPPSPTPLYQLRLNGQCPVPPELAQRLR